MYPLSECMSCGCCLEACPQYLKIELDASATARRDEAVRQRARTRPTTARFVGAHAISQVMLLQHASHRQDATPASGSTP